MVTTNVIVAGHGDLHMVDQHVKVDGVFKGGGTYGAAYPGALRALETRGITFQRVAGTSAGAILSCMIAAGYTPAQIEFLSAPVELNLPRPAGLPPMLNAHEIDYKRFVDLPTVKDLLANQEWRSSFDWIVMRWVLDKMLDVNIELPGRDDIVKAIVGGVSGLPFGDKLAGLFNAVDNKVPHQIGIGGYFDKTLRDQIADACFAGAFVASGPNPLNPAAMVTWAVGQELRARLAHLGVTGGMIKGDFFLERMERVLLAKLADVVQARGGDPHVQFRDLPIDLFVTCTNTTKQKLIVYSKRRTPTMRVAEAVRRSMSVPFVFERRVQAEPDGQYASPGDELVDGGELDNMPVWLFLVPTNDIVANDAGDLARPKLVFDLDGGAAAPDAWHAPPAPHSSQPMPSDMADAVVQKLSTDPIVSKTWEAQLLRRLYANEQVSTNGGALGWTIAQSYSSVGRPVTAIDIPLAGFGWLDWDTTVDKYKAIAFRGWQAANDAAAGAGLGLRMLLPTVNPYG